MKHDITTFYLVRHGQTEGNEKGFMSGHWDTTLTKKGESQAMVRADSLKGVKFDLAFSSDLIRAKRTAEIIAIEHDLAVHTTNLLRERSYGSMEGEKSKEEIKRIRELFAEYWKVDFKKKHKIRLDEKMENNEEIIVRILTFLRETALVYSGKNILVVSHGDIILTLLAHIGYLESKEIIEFENTGYVVLQFDGTTFTVQQAEGLRFTSNDFE